MRYSVNPATRRRTCPGCNRVRFIPIATAPYCMESCKRAALAREAVEPELTAADEDLIIDLGYGGVL